MPRGGKKKNKNQKRGRKKKQKPHSSVKVGANVRVNQTPDSSAAAVTPTDRVGAPSPISPQKSKTTITLHSTLRYNYTGKPDSSATPTTDDMDARSFISPQKMKTTITLQASNIGKFMALKMCDGCTWAITTPIEGDVGDVLEISIPAQGAPSAGLNDKGRPIYLVTKKDIRDVTHERNILSKKEKKVCCVYIH